MNYKNLQILIYTSNLKNPGNWTYMKRAKSIDFSSFVMFEHWVLEVEDISEKQVVSELQELFSFLYGRDKS